MGNPPSRVPWPYLDALEPVGATEFGTETGHVDPDAYRGKAASESLPCALQEGNSNDG